MARPNDRNVGASTEKAMGRNETVDAGRERPRMRVKTDLRAGDDLVQGNGSTYP